MKTDSFPLANSICAVNAIMSKIRWRCLNFAHIYSHITLGRFRLTDHCFILLIYKTSKCPLIFKNRMWILFRLIHLFVFNSFKYLMTLILISLLKNLFLGQIFNWVILLCISIYCYTISLVIVTKRFFIIRWNTHYDYLKCNYS